MLKSRRAAYRAITRSPDVAFTKSPDFALLMSMPAAERMADVQLEAAHIDAGRVGIGVGEIVGVDVDQLRDEIGEQRRRQSVLSSTSRGPRAVRYASTP